MFAQDTLAAGVTNILLQCRLYVVQRPGVTFYISEYGDVRALYVYVSGLLLYDKLCFSTSNYMKRHYSYSSHYLNSPQNLQSRH